MLIILLTGLRAYGYYKFKETMKIISPEMRRKHRETRPSGTDMDRNLLKESDGDSFIFFTGELFGGGGNAET